MTEIKTRLVLQHYNGKYVSWSPDNYPLTHKLSQARRFYNTEDIVYFLQNSPFKPVKPDEYSVVEMDIEYRMKEENEDANTESGTEKSKITPRN